MQHLPVYISLLFGITTLLSVLIFYRATHHSAITLITILIWLAFQGLIASSGFYTKTDTVPPRFMLLVLPPFILIMVLFLTRKGRKFLDQLDIKTLTILHTVRILVELVLFLLFLHKTVPKLMTFEGRNFDILSGLTAPLIYVLAFKNNRINKTVLLVWNFICLGLLINIVVHAILSAPFPFQQLAFDQPNIAVLYFPFVWLPCCIVPLVLLAHLATIRKLFKLS